MQHLCHDCSFTKAVRDAVLEANDLPIPPATPAVNCDFDGWWLHYIAGYPKDKKRALSGIITYIIWGSWKERNRRVFSNTALNVVDVVRLVKDEMNARSLTFSDDPGDRGG